MLEIALSPTVATAAVLLMVLGAIAWALVSNLAAIASGIGLTIVNLQDFLALYRLCPPPIDTCPLPAGDAERTMVLLLASIAAGIMLITLGCRNIRANRRRNIQGH